MNFEYLYSFYFYLMSCGMFIYYYKHLLLTMISLEFMMVMLSLNMYLILMMNFLDLLLMMFFFSIVVCEAVLGLTLIILMVRFYGNDYINSLSMLKW